MTTHEERQFVGPPPTEPPAPGEPGDGAGRSRGLGALRTLGELLITAGLLVLLFVVYELYVTDLFTAEKQSEASAALDDQWARQRSLHPELIDGKAFARLYIPVFGADYKFTVQEGVGTESLEVGPGHYKGTALPGEPGNVGIAGHRVGKGAPFNDLDLLNSCDALVLETAQDFFVYRMLPKAEEVPNWASDKGKLPQCAGVSTLRQPDVPDGGPYGLTVGQKIVPPSRGDAVAPVPYRPVDTLPPAQRAGLLTLTTCHPQFSDRERLIIHAVLTKQYRKNPDKPGELPPELLQGTEAK